MRAAIYARYSSDKQRQESIEDQFEICRRYADRFGWTIVERYADAAISGASAQRPEYQRMLKDAHRHRFHVLIAEHPDRLGRRLADVARLLDDLTFRGMAIHAPSHGALTTMHIGIMGTMAELQLEDIREKTWRGQRGRVADGKIPAGRAYGYDVGPADAHGRGHRVINSAEADVVRRIFTQFADAVSPREIARRLNEDGVPGPRGEHWRDTTIRGHRQRGTGILNNELYVGRLVWNKCSYVKDPESGKRKPRPVPPEKWEHAEVPDLRIISDDLWHRARSRQDDVSFKISRDGNGIALNRTHRRKFLLSGLLMCGCCGGGYAISTREQYACSSRRGRGTCDNTTTIGRRELEQRVLRL